MQTVYRSQSDSTAPRRLEADKLHVEVESTALPDRASVIVLGPILSAVSGVATFLNQVLTSELERTFALHHQAVGSQGRHGGRLIKYVRAALAPISLLASILSRRARIVHINTSLVPDAFWRDATSLFLAKGIRRRVVYQIHGGTFAAFCESKPVRRMAVRLALRSADVVVVLYEAERGSALQLAGPIDVRVVHHALDLARYPKQSKKYVRGASRLVYLGRLDRDKGLTDAINALALLKAGGQYESLCLTIAGSGAAEEELRALVDERKLRDSVRLVGSVFGADKLELWREADIFILPSYHEGLPYSLLESLASGTPSIVTPVGAIPEILQNGIQSMFIQPGNAQSIAYAIRELVGDRDRLRRMSQACIDLAHHEFGRERLVGNLSAIYRGLLD